MTDPLLASVQGLAPEVAQAFSDEHLFQTPEFTFEVKSGLKIPGVEKMNGPVVMKFPNLGDDIKIEQLAKALGGTNIAQMAATLRVCITKAPASWYELVPGSPKPVLNLERIVDDAVLADLYIAFTDWQRSFR